MYTNVHVWKKTTHTIFPICVPYVHTGLCPLACLATQKMPMPKALRQVTGSVLRKAGEPLNTLGYQAT